MNYIDPVKVASRHYRLLLENENVRVLEMRLPPGEKDEVRETVYGAALAVRQRSTCRVVRPWRPIFQTGT